LRQGEQPAGASLQLDGKAPFSLTLGDAGAVDELILNGEAVTLPTNSPGTVVRVSIP
jgi:cytoskeleton protein RodZ